MASLEDSVLEQVTIHLQQARSYARYLPGAVNQGTVVEDHVLTPEQAAGAVAEELDAALDLLGAEA